MVCVKTCLLATVLLGGIISTMISSQFTDIHDNLKNILDKEQMEYYKAISKERLAIYLIGLCVGCLAGLIAVNALADNPGRQTRICLFTLVTLVVNIMVYTLYPKSDYMLKHLNKPEQIDAWLKVYNEMKLKKYIGFSLGLVAYMILGDGLLN